MVSRSILCNEIITKRKKNVDRLKFKDVRTQITYPNMLVGGGYSISGPVSIPLNWEFLIYGKVHPYPGSPVCYEPRLPRPHN